jgi:hypothetical protein
MSKPKHRRVSRDFYARFAGKICDVARNELHYGGVVF